MYKKWIFNILFLLFIIYNNTLYAQKKITGFVKDSATQKPINNLYIFISDQDNNLIKFIFTDSLGNFKIDLPLQNKIYFLQINNMLYNPIISKINVEDTSKIIIKNYLLTPRGNLLDEVNVNSFKKIYKVDDTTFINVKHFTTGNEKNLEDILKTLPGIEVGNDGRITVNNKPIEKVMIEGDDFVGKGYTLVTKNITGKAIDQVQILDKYNPNKILKGVVNSNKVALNVKLKKEYLYVWFGEINAELDIINQKYNSLGSNTHLYSPKKKFFILTDFNSTGEDNTPIIYALVKENDIENKSIGLNDFSTNAFINLFPKNSPIGTSLFNNDKIVSINSIFNIGSKLKIKPIIYFQDYKHQYFTFSELSYTFNNTKFTNFEDYQFTQTNQDLIGNLLVEYDISANKTLKLNGIISKIKQNNLNQIVFNNSPNIETNDINSEFQKWNLVFSNKINSNSAFTFTNEFLKNNTPQTYFNSQFYFPFIFNNDPFQLNNNLNTTQNSNLNYTYFLSEIKYYKKINTKLNIESSISYLNKETNLKNNIYFKDSNEQYFNFNNVDSFQNNEILKYQNFNIYFQISNKINEKIGFVFNLNYNIYRLNSNSLLNQNFSLINAEYAFKYKYNKKTNWTLAIIYGENNTDNKELLRNYYLANYNNLQIGINSIQLLNKIELLLKFDKHFDLNHSYHFVGATSIEPKFIGYSSIYEPLYIIQKIKLFNNKKQFNFNYLHNLYITSISAKLFWKLAYTKSFINDEINFINREIESNNFNAQFNIKHIPSTRWNWSLSLNFNKSAFSILSQESQNTSWQLRNNWQYNIRHNIYIDLENNFYKFVELKTTQNNFLFSDIAINYRPLLNKLTLIFKIKNIFNISELKTYNVNDISIQQVSYKLQPRILYLSITYNF